MNLKRYKDSGASEADLNRLDVYPFTDGDEVENEKRRKQLNCRALQN